MATVLSAFVLSLALVALLRKPHGEGFSYSGHMKSLSPQRSHREGNPVLPAVGGLKFGEQRSAPYGASMTSVALGIVALVTMSGGGRKIPNHRTPSWAGDVNPRVRRQKGTSRTTEVMRKRQEIKNKKKAHGGTQPRGCDYAFRGRYTEGIDLPAWVRGPKGGKKMYHYYGNKIYKMFTRPPMGWVPSRLRGETTMESNSSTLEMAPTTSEFVRPSLWNKPFVRAAAVVSGGAVAGGVLPFAAMMHLSAFGVWLGTNVWTTFVAGLTMFKTLPRQQFGSLQARPSSGSCSILPGSNFGKSPVS